MRVLIVSLLLFFSFSSLNVLSQTSEKIINNKFKGVENFYADIDPETVELEFIYNGGNKNVFQYNANVLQIKSTVRYKFFHIVNSEGKTLTRKYINNNSINIKLAKNRYFYVRLDTEFKTHYYLLRT